MTDEQRPVVLPPEQEYISPKAQEFGRRPAYLYTAACPDERYRAPPRKGGKVWNDKDN